MTMLVLYLLYEICDYCDILYVECISTGELVIDLY